MRKISLDAQNAALYLQGLPWFEANGCKTHRLPLWAQNRLPQDLWDVSQDPSGGRICFEADTTCCGIRCVVENYDSRQGITVPRTRGFDLYVDGVFWKNALPMANGRFEEMFFRETPRQKRRFTIYLPLYLSVNELAFIVDDEATVSPPQQGGGNPLVFYGTSITHGFNASRPGLAFAAVAARRLGRGFVNYGFSGTGRGEAAMAEVVAATRACCYILDYGQNSETLREFAQCYPAFARLVRAQNPGVPILMTLPIRYLHELWDAEAAAFHQGRRRIVREAYDAMREADPDVHLLDWNEHVPFDTGEGQSDGAHPNDLGQWWMAEALCQKLEEIL